VASRRPLKIALFGCVILAAAMGAAGLLAWFATSTTASPTLLRAAVDARLGLLSASDTRYVEMAVRLRLRNPAREARSAVEARDYRLVAVSGLGLFIPGTPRTRDTRYYSDRYGIREVIGAGDTGNEYMLIYQREALAFAERFNLVVLRALHEQAQS
jgi:hypothetical protein